MIRTHLSIRHVCILLACASLLSACEGGREQYDSKGNYIYSEMPDGSRSRPGDHNVRKARDDYSVRGNNSYYSERESYMRPGTYDHNGDYVISDNPINVPQSMAPARGMCRVWFTNRAPSEQPAVESCNDIRARVPVGAYVVYGG